jgi:lipocalin
MKNQLCTFTVMGVFMIILTGAPIQAKSTTELDTTTVRQLDLQRYMGKWYEIARYNHWFEKGMTHVIAEYSMQPDGKIRVVNKGIKNGKLKEIIGKARQLHPKEYPGRLEVSFFLWFYGDYYILELDKDYQYVVIGSSTDKYLWIMSRTPQLPDETLQRILSMLERRGYDVSKLIMVEQY